MVQCKIKKKRIKPKKPKTQTQIENALLKIWAVKVKERDNWTCQICRKFLKFSSPQSCHAHHIIPKIIRETRLDLDNGITLCAYHHGGNPKLAAPYSPHQNALWFANWLKFHKNEQYEKLTKILREIQQN